MVEIPGGKFIVGSDAGEEDEKPAHEANVPAFLIDKYEVTNLQFRDFIDAGGYGDNKFWINGGWELKEKNKLYEPYFWKNPRWNADNAPVVGVSWYEAAAYAEWAGKRLPTEAEWEKAAKGASGTAYPWGNTFVKGCANCGTETAAAVGSMKNGRSEAGVYDLIGNVWEWCADWYDSGYYSLSEADSPKGPEKGDKKSLRGGSYMEPEGSVCATSRKSRAPEDRRFSCVGFRCAKSK
jgi:formylglycine-generating enzyme